MVNTQLIAGFRDGTVSGSRWRDAGFPRPQLLRLCKSAEDLAEGKSTTIVH